MLDKVLWSSKIFSIFLPSQDVSLYNMRLLWPTAGLGTWLCWIPYNWPWSLCKRGWIYPPTDQHSHPACCVCKQTEGTLGALIKTIDNDIEQDWPQCWALGNPISDQPPSGGTTIHHHSLGLDIHPDTLQPTEECACPSHSFARKMAWEAVLRTLLKCTSTVSLIH